MLGTTAANLWSLLLYSNKVTARPPTSSRYVNNHASISKLYWNRGPQCDSSSEDVIRYTNLEWILINFHVGRQQKRRVVDYVHAALEFKSGNILDFSCIEELSFHGFLRRVFMCPLFEAE